MPLEPVAVRFQTFIEIEWINIITGIFNQPCIQSRCNAVPIAVNIGVEFRPTRPVARQLS